jgi:hypothetical protein
MTTRCGCLLQWLVGRRSPLGSSWTKKAKCSEKKSLHGPVCREVEASDEHAAFANKRRLSTTENILVTYDGVAKVVDFRLW